MGKSPVIIVLFSNFKLIKLEIYRLESFRQDLRREFFCRKCASLWKSFVLCWINHLFVSAPLWWKISQCDCASCCTYRKFLSLTSRRTSMTARDEFARNKVPTVFNLKCQQKYNLCESKLRYYMQSKLVRTSEEELETGEESVPSTFLQNFVRKKLQLMRVNRTFPAFVDSTHFTIVRCFFQPSGNRVAFVMHQHWFPVKKSFCRFNTRHSC